MRYTSFLHWQAAGVNEERKHDSIDTETFPPLTMHVFAKFDQICDMFNQIERQLGQGTKPVGVTA